MEKYFRILGLEQGASQKEVKLAYRKLAMRYHPDKKSGSKAKFLEILEAYEVISGLRKAEKQEPQFTTQQAKEFYDLIQKLAKQRAKAQYRERAAKIKQQKEELQAKEFQKALIYLLTIVLMGAASYFGYNWYYDFKIDSQKASAQALVTAIGVNKVVYQFEVNGIRYKEEKYVHKAGFSMLAGNGMPLKVGDEFSLSYNSEDPTINRLEYEKISATTLQRYIELAKNSMLSAFRESWHTIPADQRGIKAECLTLLVYEQFGIDGLAQLVFWDEALLENFEHNTFSWYFFKRSDKFKEVVELCRTNF